jgi:hypothetical protein
MSRRRRKGAALAVEVIKKRLASTRKFFGILPIQVRYRAAVVSVQRVPDIVSSLNERPETAHTLEMSSEIILDSVAT